ncbi:MAG: carboxypeptidase regulatory-like domain-containing protein [Rhodospirillales bacterium]|nr:carboxypeptidase regulatory-like domain-containing protein [Rhodospirillales bacterium]
MMRRTWLSGLLSAAIVAGFVGVAAAQSALEPQTTPGGINWVSGGIGFDESLALRKIEGNYNLRLLFAVEGSGEYLADVVVIIQNQEGQAVLEATSQGPRLLAQVPPGGYTVTATSGGSTVTRRLNVPRGRTVENSFYFPAQ